MRTQLLSRPTFLPDNSLKRCVPSTRQRRRRWASWRWKLSRNEQRKEVSLTAIEVQQLTKTFVIREKQPGLRGSARALFRPVRQETQAVKGINFTVEEGERVAFTAGIVLAARAVFRWGLRRYESGNLVTVRG